MHFLKVIDLDGEESVVNLSLLEFMRKEDGNWWMVFRAGNVGVSEDEARKVFREIDDVERRRNESTSDLVSAVRTVGCFC